MPVINTIDRSLPLREKDRDEEVSREIEKGAHLLLSILYLMLT